jgi:SAM-dependent methyltransferase
MSNSADQFTVQWDAVDPWDESYPHLWVKVEHLGRYLFAARYLQSIGAGDLADIACGFGYGAHALAQFARSVLAIDEDPAILETARERYPHPVITYDSASLGTVDLGSLVSPGSLDGIVSFETLEHVTDPASVLNQFAGCLRNEGTLILSVPNSMSERINDEGLPTNSMHKRFFSISSISELVESSGFDVTEVLGQPIASQIQRNETRLIRRKQTDGRIAEEPALHRPMTMQRLALALGYPEPRDIELSYAITVVARRS